MLHSVTGIDDGNESTMIVTDVHIDAPSNEQLLLNAAETKLANMTMEREIFLRAALQLLDQREHGNATNEKKKVKNFFKRYKSSNAKKASTTDESAMDVIRYGSLRKANRRYKSVVPMEGWKRKFVELRHVCNLRQCAVS